MLNIKPSLRPRFRNLVGQWAGCTKCPCALTRTQIVHYRGSMPCDVLFVGEAPGDSEDSLGEPFVGPAGDKFDEMREAAWVRAFMDNTTAIGRIPSWGVCNIVACRPKTPKTPFDSGTIRDPTKEEAAACRPRLVKLIKLANPRLVITLGKVAGYNLPDLDPKRVLVVCHLTHPSAILRTDDSRKALAEKRWVLAMADFLKVLMP
jgi:uracil-DNA glycosylase